MPSPKEVISYAKLADEFAIIHGVPRSLYRGMIEQESSWDPAKVNTTSGARGLIQIVPVFHPKDQHGKPLNPHDPKQALDYGAYELRRYRNLALRLGFAHTTREAWRVAIAGWHAGWTTIVYYGGIPPTGYGDEDIDTLGHVDKVFQKGGRISKALYGPDEPETARAKEEVAQGGLPLLHEGSSLYTRAERAGPVGEGPTDGQGAAQVMAAAHGAGSPTGVSFSAARPAEDLASTSKGGTGSVPIFKDPAGNLLPEGSREVKHHGGDKSRPVIDKGDGSFLTPGQPKDAQWTADRIEEGRNLGLNTGGWWEGSPVEIQSAINQAKIAKQWAPPPAPPTQPVQPQPQKPETPKADDSWRSEIEREKLEIQRSKAESEKALAWFKAITALEGRSGWIPLSETLRGQPKSDMPAWLTNMGSGGATNGSESTGSGSASAQAWARLQESVRLPSWLTKLGEEIEQRRLERERQDDWPAGGWPAAAPQPQSVGVKHWARLQPSQKEGMRNLVQMRGGDVGNWLESMRRSWPRWRPAPRTRVAK